MNAATVDTLKFARDLEENGAFILDQAARLAETLSAALGADLATKSDVRESGAALKAELRETELRLEAKLADAKSELLKWLFGLVGFQTLVIIGSLVALARPLH